jgi:hypothetical protein
MRIGKATPRGKPMRRILKRPSGPKRRLAPSVPQKIKLE